MFENLLRRWYNLGISSPPLVEAQNRGSRERQENKRCIRCTRCTQCVRSMQGTELLAMGTQLRAARRTSLAHARRDIIVARTAFSLHGKLQRPPSTARTNGSSRVVQVLDIPQERLIDVGNPVCIYRTLNHAKWMFHQWT